MCYEKLLLFSAWREKQRGRKKAFDGSIADLVGNSQVRVAKGIRQNQTLLHLILK